MKPYQRRERARRDEKAASYDSWSASNKGRLFDELERQTFRRFVGADRKRRGADIGAGTGRVSETVAPLVENLVAVDISAESLRVLDRKEVDGCLSVCADTCDLPFPDESFDVIISCQTLQVLRFDEALRALQEVRRVMVPGASFIFSVYNFPYWHYRGVIEWGEAEGAYVRPYTEGFVRYLADKVDLDVVRVGYYKSLPFRRLKSRSWLLLDRGVAAIPFVRRRANALMIAELRKGA